ncbi:hypothetical protein H0H93_005109, partial [Arthromyces matolae]
YAKLKKEASLKGGSEDSAKEIEDLKKKLAAEQAKSRDFETLKKQAAQQHDEYNKLATKYNEATGNTSDKRAD